MLENVPALLSSPPGTPGSTRVQRVLVDPATQELSLELEGGFAAAAGGLQTACAEHDVTGGIATKVACAASVATSPGPHSGVPVLITSAGPAGHMDAVLAACGALAACAAGGDWLRALAAAEAAASGTLVVSTAAIEPPPDAQ